LDATGFFEVFNIGAILGRKPPGINPQIQRGRGQGRASDHPHDLFICPSNRHAGNEIENAKRTAFLMLFALDENCNRNIFQKIQSVVIKRQSTGFQKNKEERTVSLSRTGRQIPLHGRRACCGHHPGITLRPVIEAEGHWWQLLWGSVAYRLKDRDVFIS